MLWTAGVAASPVVKLLGTTMDRAGRAFVGAFLDIPEAPYVFVVGDAAAMTQDGHPCPASRKLPSNKDALSVVSLPTASGDARTAAPSDTATKAIWRWSARTSPSSRPVVRTGGFLTWLVWAALHVLALPQLQNRFRVQTQWFWSYLSGQRSSRLISERPRPPASR